MLCKAPAASDSSPRELHERALPLTPSPREHPSAWPLPSPTCISPCRTCLTAPSAGVGGWVWELEGCWSNNGLIN